MAGPVIEYNLLQKYIDAISVVNYDQLFKIIIYNQI